MNISQFSSPLPKPWLSIASNDLSSNTLKLAQDIVVGGVEAGYSLLYADNGDRLNVASQTAPTQQIAYLSDIPIVPTPLTPGFIESPNEQATVDCIDDGANGAIRAILGITPVLTIDTGKLDYLQGQASLHLPIVCDGLSQAGTAYLAAGDTITSSGFACATGFSALVRNSLPRLVCDTEITMFDTLGTDRLKVLDYGVFMRGSGVGTGVESRLNLDSDIFFTRDGGAGQSEIFYASNQGTQIFSSDGLTRLYLQNSTEPNGQGVFINPLLGGYRLPLVDGSAGQVITTNGAGASSWITPTIGLFSQTSTQTVANTTAESSLLGAGVGSLTVPPGYFQNGYSFIFNVGGLFRDSSNGQLIRFRLRNSGVLFDSGNLTLSNVNTLRGWNISCQFTYYGGNIISNLSFSYTDGVNNTAGFTNQGTNPINNLVANTLSLSVQWGTASAQNTITSNFATLTKVY